jgi:hypothetical protein
MPLFVIGDDAPLHRVEQAIALLQTGDDSWPDQEGY